MNVKPEDSLGADIKIIREILFGEHLKSIYQDLAAIRDEIAQLKNQDQKLEAALEGETAQRGQQGQKLEAALQSEAAHSREEAARTEAEKQRQLHDLDQRIQALDQRLVEQIMTENRERQLSLTETNDRMEANFARLRQEIDALFSEHHTVHQALIRSLAAALLQYQDQPNQEAIAASASND